MTWIRGIALISLLSAAAWLVQREQNAGRLQRIDDAFLDFLVANSRDRFENPSEDIQSTHPVVKIVLDQADAIDYSDWPPQPLDWQMLIKALQPFAPEVLVVTTPLSWGHPAPDFVPAVAEALLPFPSVVLAAEAMTIDEGEEDHGKTTSSAFLGDLDSTLPRFKRISGPNTAAALQAIVTPPDTPLRRSGEVGLIVPEAEDTASAVVRSGSDWLPTLSVQALSRQTRTPYSRTRIRLGSGAGLYLDGGVYVPLTQDGKITSHSSIEVPEVNALNLLTEGFTELLTESEKARLGSGKLMVIGIRDPNPDTISHVDQQAAALAAALSAPRIQVVPTYGQWGIWAAVAGFSLWLGVFASRPKTLKVGIIVGFLAFASGFVAFQSSLWWCPPSVPLAILVVGTLFGRVFGRRPALPSEPHSSHAKIEGETATE